MDKIKAMFVSEKQIKKSANTITLGDLINNEVPDTYDIVYACIKDDIIEQITRERPQILFIAQVKGYNLYELVEKIKDYSPEIVILVSLDASLDNEQEAIERFTEIGVYKCYSTSFSIDALIHDMFVSMNME